MKDLSIKIRSIFFFLILFLLAIPYIQNTFEFIKLAPLKGAIIQSEKKIFNLENWFSGEYQLQQEKYLNETFGFRSFFIRVNNQISFNFFNRANANGVIIGKDNYLFEEIYIKSYYGRDFIGADSINHRIQRLKFIQDTLSKLNKNIILVFAAGKGSYYPEYFPADYKSEKGPTNYQIHEKFAREAGLNYIDFNKYFIDNKTKSEYPLYPQYGIHWSYYGMCLAADSMIHYIERLRNIDMPDLYWNNIKLSLPNECDYDVADGMNILFRLRSFKMAYPEIHFEPDSGKTKPSVLVIADSYYWGMFNFGISNAFSNSHFWFYNKQIYPESYKSTIETNQVNLKEEIRKHDVIFIMATEATLPALGWGFIEDTYELFNGRGKLSISDPEFQKKLRNLRNYILTDKIWIEALRKKAQERNISIDSMITIDATWLIQSKK